MTRPPDQPPRGDRDDPGASGDRDDRDIPGSTGDPGSPDDRDMPGSTGDPGSPDDRDIPGNPGNPGNSGDSGNSGNPDNPGDPGDSGGPSGPNDPSDLGLRVERILAALPAGPDLAPLLDLLVARSRPDPTRRWSASGELGSAGDRLLAARDLSATVAALAREEAKRLEARFRTGAEVVEHLAEGEVEAAAEALLRRGEAEEGVGRAPTAEEWYRAAHRLAREAGSALAPGILRRLARTLRTQGALGEAAGAYEEAWRAARDAELDEDRIVAATGRGNVDVDRGRWAEAEAWYQRALEVVGENGPPRRERWQLGQNLAIVRREQGDLEGAARWLAVARRDGEALDDPDARIEVANGWGQLLQARGDARGAELHFREALAAADGNPRALAAVGVNLGEALLAQGRELEAGEAAREAEAWAIAGRLVGRLPEVYRLLAAVAHARGEADAFVFLERTLELIRRRGLPAFEEARTLDAYAELLDEGGQSERADEMRAQARAILSETRGEERS